MDLPSPTPSAINRGRISSVQPFENYTKMLKNIALSAHMLCDEFSSHITAEALKKAFSQQLILEIIGFPKEFDAISLVDLLQACIGAFVFKNVLHVDPQAVDGDWEGIPFSPESGEMINNKTRELIEFLHQVTNWKPVAEISPFSKIHERLWMVLRDAMMLSCQNHRKDSPSLLDFTWPQCGTPFDKYSMVRWMPGSQYISMALTFAASLRFNNEFMIPATVISTESSEQMSSDLWKKEVHLLRHLLTTPIYVKLPIQASSHIKAVNDIRYPFFGNCEELEAACYIGGAERAA